jgi:hypothetical protein
MSEIFFTDARAEIRLAPIDRPAAEHIWKANERMLTAENLHDERLLPGSPLEDLLHRLRRQGSPTQPSALSGDEGMRELLAPPNTDPVEDGEADESDSSGDDSGIVHAGDDAGLNSGAEEDDEDTEHETLMTVLSEEDGQGGGR